MKLLLSFQFLMLAFPAFALIHKSTQYFIDVELPKNQLSIDCSDHPENSTSYLGFELLDKDVCYSFYYRRPISVKMCHEQKKEYAKIIERGPVRVVGIKPEIEIMKDSERMKFSALCSKAAKKIVWATFIRLQAGNKCKAYFEDDCELPKNYWGGVSSDE